MPTMEELNAELDAKRAEAAKAKEDELLRRAAARAAAGDDAKGPRPMAYNEDVRAEAVEKNKSRNAATMPQMTPERAARVARAQELRSQLAAFAAMPREARDAPAVQKHLRPMLVEYVKLRYELAADAVTDILVSELGMTMREVGEVVIEAAPDVMDMNRTVAVSGVAGGSAVGPPRIIGGGTAGSPYIDDRVMHLEHQVAMLNARVAELVGLRPWADEAQQRLADVEARLPSSKADAFDAAVMVNGDLERRLADVESRVTSGERGEWRVAINRAMPVPRAPAVPVESIPFDLSDDEKTPVPTGDVPPAVLPCGCDYTAHPNRANALPAGPNECSMGWPKPTGACLAYLSPGDTPYASGDVAYRGCFTCGRPRSEHAR